MFKNKKKFIMLVILVIGVCFSSGLVKAAGVVVGTDENKTYVCYDRKTGEYKGTSLGNKDGCTSKGYGQTSVKLIEDIYAYCTNWKLKYYSKNNYVVDDTWKINSANAIKAGYLINLVNSGDYSVNLAYGRTGATLNTYFAKVLGESGSYNYYSDNEISGYMSKADSYYNSVKGYMSNKLPLVGIDTGNGTVLHYNDTTGKYFSNKITISGLVATYGGDNDTVSYIVSAKSKSGKDVSICSDSKGSSCQNGTVNISNKSGSYSFYLFVDKSQMEAGESVAVSIKGSNKSTYYSSILYKDTLNKDAQKLIKISNYDISRSISNSVSLIIPDLVNHRIHAYKVDEDGNNLDGAVLEIYKDNTDGEALASNKGVGFEVTYTTPMVTEGEDDFFNHDYYLVEKKAPSGYILSSAPIKIFSKGTASGQATLTCYATNDDGGLDEVDMEYCYPERYKYMCKHPTTGELVDVDESGNCPAIPSNDLEQNGNEDSSTGEENTDTDDSLLESNAVTGNGEVSDNDTIGGTIINPNAVYTKVCYNKDTSSEANLDFCSNKGIYTKVWKGGDGNINIKKPNTKNLVKISKQDITSEKEVVGAKLKVCTNEEYSKNKFDCSPALTVDGIEMSFISGEEAYSIYGIPVGSYYIVEVTPPNGYLQATTAVSFSINEEGVVASGGKQITYNEFTEGKAIVINNKLTSITISKQDIATKEELPGATISICQSYIDSDGNVQMLVDQYTGDCIEATLASGSKATWVSTNKPKFISGLTPGTYYLVERIAPTDYATAESIIFTLTDDGILTDINGNSLSDNKLVMYDEIIVNEKTGSLSLYIVIGGFGIVILLGIGTYLYIKKKKILN